jgi:hypothetical protein
VLVPANKRTAEEPAPDQQAVAKKPRQELVANELTPPEKPSVPQQEESEMDHLEPEPELELESLQRQPEPAPPNRAADHEQVSAATEHERGSGEHDEPEEHNPHPHHKYHHEVGDEPEAGIRDGAYDGDGDCDDGNEDEDGDGQDSESSSGDEIDSDFIPINSDSGSDMDTDAGEESGTTSGSEPPMVAARGASAATSACGGKALPPIGTQCHLFFDKKWWDCIVSRANKTSVHVASDYGPRPWECRVRAAEITRLLHLRRGCSSGKCFADGCTRPSGDGVEETDSSDAAGESSTGGQLGVVSVHASEQKRKKTRRSSSKQPAVPAAVVAFRSSRDKYGCDAELHWLPDLYTPKRWEKDKQPKLLTRFAIKVGDAFNFPKVQVNMPGDRFDDGVTIPEQSITVAELITEHTLDTRKIQDRTLHSSGTKLRDVPGVVQQQFLDVVFKGRPVHPVHMK